MTSAAPSSGVFRGPAALSIAFPSVAIGATDHALGYLCQNCLPGIVATASHPTNGLPFFCSVDVVKVQNDRVVLATINTRMLFEIFQHQHLVFRAVREVSIAPALDVFIGHTSIIMACPAGVEPA